TTPPLSTSECAWSQNSSPPFKEASYCYSPRRRTTVTVAAKHLARDLTLTNTDATMQEDGCTSARSSSCLTEGGRHPPQETGTRSPGLVQPAIAGVFGRRRAGLRQGNQCSPSALSREKNPTASLAGSPAGLPSQGFGPRYGRFGPRRPRRPRRPRLRAAASTMGRNSLEVL
ncbi:hypothetical protein CSHISOI_09390, partial [Colletotrichum shisoi]